MLRPSLRAPRLAASLGLRATLGSRRSIHQMPSLLHDFSEGVPNLMSPAGFQIAWTDYMGLMVEKLNALTAGTEFEDKDTKTIALMTAREPNQAPIFNYASMAHNNHFFFKGISPTGTPMPDSLRQALETSFGSIETLRREFVVTASAMFGPGYVWLVRAGHNDYRILNTYLAGSPYAGAHWRRQGSDMNTLGHNGTAKPYWDSIGQSRRQTPSKELPPGGIDLKPLLCLSTWEHSWLLDWGVGREGHGGKAAFAESWWELIDWEQVAQRSPIQSAPFQSAGGSPNSSEASNEASSESRSIKI